MTLLSAQDLGKAFRTYRSEWQRFARWFGMSIKPSTEHWVLRHVNFDIQPGEAIGIIGQNGAGKSTLLKMITGTLQPTEGRILVNGRIAAILELGMGFNPELTGRQNAHHVLGLMGLHHTEIAQIMPELESFADIGEYFDQPVRVYSSGMQMRVAFSVSTAFKPELLIVDEALSVGDAAFQRKSFRRIETYMSEGMSLILVSHDVETIKKICSKALFLCAGKQRQFGDTKQVCDEYEQHLFGTKNATGPAPAEHSSDLPQMPLIDASLLTESEHAYGDGRAVIEAVWIEDDQGRHVNILSQGKPFNLNFKVRFSKAIAEPIFAFLLKTVEGVAIYGTDTRLLEYATGNYEIDDTVHISVCLDNCLAAGIYFINVGVRDDSKDGCQFMHRRVDVLMVRVAQQGTSLAQVGLVNLNAHVDWQRP